MTKTELVKKHVEFACFDDIIEMRLEEDEDECYLVSVLPQNEEDKNTLVISFGFCFVHFNLTDKELLKVRYGGVIENGWYNQWIL